MCGITGFVSRDAGTSCEELRRTVANMARQMVSRGPDDFGEWVDDRGGTALGFRRLSIIDLSPTGHQPMHSASGRYVVIYNGEVYNFRDIRADLESKGATFRGGSDTEVILAAVEEYGLQQAVQKFVGMFAIALWDRKQRVLNLVRDRLGVKPLYYGNAGNTFLFGSELKALRAHPHFNNEIDRDALALMMRYSYVPSPYCIYRGIHKLPPGCILTVDSEGAYGEPEAYWSAREAVRQQLAHPFTGTAVEAADELETLLSDATRMRMIADVPLGVFLSGGIDSSVITALMQAQSTGPVKTFTVGFAEDAFDEAQYARNVARHLHTHHTELTITAADALNVIPELPQIYDEPFADVSQIPTLLVSRLARKHVTVSLSGDGGDELFGGYVRHFGGRGVWNIARRIPLGVRRSAANAIRAVRPNTWSSILKATGHAVPSKHRQRNPAEKLVKIAEAISASSPEEMYTNLISHWKSPCEVVPSSREPCLSITDPEMLRGLDDFTERMLYLDTVTYLPDDILVKVDRASMGVSLEARGPLLDHRVLEFAWRLPLNMKIRNGQGKWLLRQVLHRHVPEHLFNRPKAGFAVPIDDWLRGSLRDWAEALLDESRLRAEGFFDPAPIRAVWQEHLSGAHNRNNLLWTVLMFQAWVERT